MLFHFLGTGTSQGVPEILCECPVCISEDPRDARLRCSLCVEVGDFHVVVDTGPDFRQQCLRTPPPRIDAILITHMHADHIVGLDDVRRYNRLQEERIPIYIPKQFEQDFRTLFGYTLRENDGLYRPKLDLKYAESTPIIFPGFEVSPIPVMHGSDEILGYMFTADGRRFAYLTDCKHMSKSSLDLVRGVDVLVVGALWGAEMVHPAHMNIEEACKLVGKINPKMAYFTHITHFMGRYSDVNASLPDNVELAYDGLVVEL